MVYPSICRTSVRLPIETTPSTKPVAYANDGNKALTSPLWCKLQSLDIFQISDRRMEPERSTYNRQPRKWTAGLRGPSYQVLRRNLVGRDGLTLELQVNGPDKASVAEWF